MGKHFSFIHCADLHLGEPFGGVRLGTKGPWNEQIGKATFKAFEKVVDAALENRVDAACGYPAAGDGACFFFRRSDRHPAHEGWGKSRHNLWHQLQDTPYEG